MYQRYKDFICDQKNIDDAVDNVKFRDKDQTKEKIENTLVGAFVEKYVVHGDFNIDNGIFNDFPITEQLILLERFTADEYAYAWSADYEVAKLVYKFWKQYDMDTLNWKNYNKTYPHGQIFNCLYTIKTNLLEFGTERFSTKEKRWQVIKNQGRGCRYLYWHLFAFLPLLKDDGLNILMKIAVMEYGDAKDMLMMGLTGYAYQDWITIPQFLPHLRKVLALWATDAYSIKYCSGTGMIGHLLELIRIYKSHGVYLFDDSEIRSILDSRNITENDYLKFIKYINKEEEEKNMLNEKNC